MLVPRSGMWIRGVDRVVSCSKRIVCVHVCSRKKPMRVERLLDNFVSSAPLRTCQCRRHAHAKSSSHTGLVSSPGCVCTAGLHLTAHLSLAAWQLPLSRHRLSRFIIATLA